MSLKVIKFSAVWCPPCRALQPIWDQLVDEINDVEFEMVDIDKDEENKSGTYNVRAVPTIVFVKDGKAVDSMVGLRSAADIKERIEQYKG